jgi:hypothetical protein
VIAFPTSVFEGQTVSSFLSEVRIIVGAPLQKISAFSSKGLDYNPLIPELQPAKRQVNI